MHTKLFLIGAIIFSLAGCQNDFFQQNKFEVISMANANTILLNKTSGETWLLVDRNWILITTETQNKIIGFNRSACECEIINQLNPEEAKTIYDANGDVNAIEPSLASKILLLHKQSRRCQ